MSPPTRNKPVKFEFKRAAFVVPLIYLNFIFLVASGAFQWIPFALWGLYWLPMKYIDIQVGLGLQHTIDFLSIVSLVLMLSMLYIWTAKGGRVARLLRAVQITSLSFVPLGVEIFLFDSPEWNLHASQLQVDLGVIPWFTNADLLFLCSAVFASTTLARSYAPKLQIRRGDSQFNRLSLLRNPISKFFLYKRHSFVRSKIKHVHSTLLDIGCGLYKIRSDAIGLEVKAWKHPDVLGSVFAIPFRKNQFDCVTMLELLEHMNNQRQHEALDEVRQVLVPGGLFIMSMPNMSKWWANPYKVIWAIWEATVQKEYQHEHIGMFPQERIERLLREHFELLESHRVAWLDRVFVCRNPKVGN
jgi:SAM-dependent methyltransferase